MVVPTGTTIPPLPHLLAVLIALSVIGWVLYRRAPPITDLTVLAFAPWMVVGAAVYVTYQLGILPSTVAPFASSPTVYGTVTVLAGIVWLAARYSSSQPQQVLGAIGVIAILPPTIAAVLTAERLTPLVPTAAALTAIGVTLLYWGGVRTWNPGITVTGYAGGLVVFGQALDAFSTAFGIAHLGFSEQTPLSRLLIEATADMPLPLVGAGWLYILVKLGLAIGILWLLTPTVDDHPREGYLLLAVVAAVGLGPGAHNLLLFTVTTA